MELLHSLEESQNVNILRLSPAKLPNNQGEAVQSGRCGGRLPQFVHGERVEVVGDDVHKVPVLLPPGRVGQLGVGSSPGDHPTVQEQLLGLQVVFDKSGQLQGPVEGGVVQLVTALPGQDGGVIFVG